MFNILVHEVYCFMDNYRELSNVVSLGMFSDSSRYTYAHAFIIYVWECLVLGIFLESGLLSCI